MKRILILGAGGHAQVVADILVSGSGSREYRVVGFLDDDTALQGTEIMGTLVLGPIDRFATVEHDGLVVAIGDNQPRARVFDACRARGARFINAIHPTAVVGSGVRFGEGVMVCAGVLINPHAVIGDDVILNTGCSIDHHVQIGAHVHIGPGANLAGTVRVGEGALVGIGANVVPGRVIGDWSVVGAGAAVVRDIPAHVTAVGVPARVTVGSRSSEKLS